MNALHPIIQPSSLHKTMAACVVLVFLCLLPFAGALEVHHIFAEVDHDGHVHSDFDLCQWIQAHGNGSVDLNLIDLGIPLRVEHKRSFTSDIIAFKVILTSRDSRGPPLFL